MGKDIIINIGRQLGSGGRQIGKMLAEDFGMRFMDKELLTLAAERSGMCQEIFEKADENGSQTFSGLFSMRFPFVNEGGLPTNNLLSNDSLFKVQSDAIRDLASREPCVFIGRCADYVLRDFPQCVNVFVCAPKEKRIEHVAERLEISRKKAEELVNKTDRKRAEYYNYYTSRKWGMASTYHLCVDSSLLGLEGTKELVKEFALRRFGT